MTDKIIERRSAGPPGNGDPNWVEARLDPIEKHIVELQEELQEIQNEVEKIKDSMPHGSVPHHKVMHQEYMEIAEAQEKKEEENAKLRLEIRNSFIKTAVQAILAAIVGIVILGLNAQFNTLVHKAIIDTPPAVVEKK